MVEEERGRNRTQLLQQAMSRKDTEQPDHSVPPPSEPSAQPDEQKQFFFSGCQKRDVERGTNSVPGPERHSRLLALLRPWIQALRALGWVLTGRRHLN